MKLTEKGRERLLRILGALSLLLIAITGVAFIASSVWINAQGGSPYTYESIGHAFRTVSPLVWVTLALVAVTGILSLLLPIEEGKLRPMRDSLARLQRVRRERDASAIDSHDAALIERDLRTSHILVYTLTALLTVGVTVTLIYTLDLSNYTDEYNASVARAAVLAALSLLPSIILAVVLSFRLTDSADRELAILSKMPKIGVSGGACQEKNGISHAFSSLFADGSRSLLITRCVLVAVSLVFITLGIFNGGMRDVLEKAVKICTECIGLG